MFNISLNDNSNIGRKVIVSLCIILVIRHQYQLLYFLNVFNACIISHVVMLLFNMLFAISCFIINGAFSSFHLFILFSKRLLSIRPCGGVLCFKKQ